MSSVGTAAPRAGAYRALVLATLAFALCFAVWGLVSPLATRFQELYELSSTQISVVIATPVILGSLFRIPIGLLTDRFGGRAVFSALMLALIVPVLFIGLLGGSFGGLLFWGFFLGLAGSSFAVGVAVALFGVLPRFMAFGGWAVLAACALIEEFGRPLQLSERMLDLSPFAHVPKLPGGDVSAAPLLWLALIVVALAAVGLLGFRRRDVL